MSYQFEKLLSPKKAPEEQNVIKSGIFYFNL